MEAVFHILPSFALRPRPPLTALDDLPVPDYSEYFERAKSLGLLTESFFKALDIPFESSRGCWWGHKHHCTFCGLNGSSIVYRAKTPRRMLDELNELSGRYPYHFFEAVDNILDFSYFHTFIKSLAQEHSKLNIFYEVKANLNKEQLELLKEAGVMRIQPGIESLSSHVLELMRKDISAIQNVNTLRWAGYFGINVGWNIIWGFPGETEEDYRRQAELFPLLFQLQPPGSHGRVWMERFSPMFIDRNSFPTRYLEPEASYSFVYPRGVDLNRIAYFFDYEFEQVLPSTAYEGMNRQVELWEAAWKEKNAPSLIYWAEPDLLRVEDRQNREKPRAYTYGGDYAVIYQACSDKPRTLLSLTSDPALDYSETRLQAMLDNLCGRGLVMQDENYYLSLGLPATRPRKSKTTGNTPAL